MQKQFVLPSKKRVDIVSVVARFKGIIPEGETITTGECTVSVFSGDDAAPQDILDGSIIISGTDLRHRIKLGIPGVIYQLVFSATTDAENTYEMECRQAVLIDNLPAGPVYQQFYFTTPPYPVETREATGYSFLPDDGRFLETGVEGIDSSFEPTFGELREIVIPYHMEAEGIESAFLPGDGTLRDIIITYSMEPEGIDSSFVPGDGTLVDIIILYQNYPPEGIDSSFLPLSGTLT